MSVSAAQSIYHYTTQDNVNAIEDQINRWSDGWLEAEAPTKRTFSVLRLHAGQSFTDLSGIVLRPVSILSDVALGIFKSIRPPQNHEVAKAPDHFNSALESLVTLPFFEAYYAVDFALRLSVGLVHGLAHMTLFGLFPPSAS